MSAVFWTLSYVVKPYPIVALLAEEKRLPTHSKDRSA
jgi:hypothetical protein